MGSTSSKFAVAIHILAFLGCRKGGFSNSGQVAGSVKTNPVVIRRLLLELSLAGLVKCHSGKNGGACLAQSPSKITLLDIYQAVQKRDLFGIPQKAANPKCQVSSQMKKILIPAFENAQKAAERSLKKVTLSQLIRHVNS